MMADPSPTLRTPAQLLEAFALAAAQFSDCPRMIAFLNSARDDGLVTVPTSCVPRMADGRPAIGQLNIGGDSKTNFRRLVTFYGIGGARLVSEHESLNVGFILYGKENDEAAAKFRELGSEAGIVVTLHDLVRGIQSYDNSLVLWSFIVYAMLQGSSWLSQIDTISETTGLHFNPFIASVETLKRLLVCNEPTDGEPAIPAGASGLDSPAGFMGGVALADALRIHPSQRAAFSKRLHRERPKLDRGTCWIETADPGPNAPQYLFLASDPRVLAIAAPYRQPMSD